ncbi:hypothetical protein JCM10450v2_006702 [Rhodotorula kratochvilovae]
MMRPALYLACLLSIAIHSGTALPIPLYSSTSGILPAAWSPSNPQRPFARQVAPPRLRIVDDDDEHSPSAAAGAATRPSPFASLSAALAQPTPLAAPANPARTPAATDDSIFSEAILPGGVEASLAAVMAARRAEDEARARRLEKAATGKVGKKELKRMRKAAWEAQQQRRVGGGDRAKTRGAAETTARNVASSSTTSNAAPSTVAASSSAGAPASSLMSLATP